MRASPIARVALLVLLVLVLAARAGAGERHTAGRVLAGLRCIHSHEGSWRADTGNGYYGGLQMNAAFERAYGLEFVRAFGHANHWPPALQLAVGVRAWAHRGYDPWPATSRICGLR